MNDLDDFQKRLSTGLQTVREQIRAGQEAEKQQSLEAHQKQAEETEQRSKALGVQIRFREQFITPCYKSIQKEIPGGHGTEHDEPRAGWTYHFDCDNARIELLIEYNKCGYRIIARAYVDERPVNNESIEFSEDEFQPEKAGDWLQEQAIRCAMETVAQTKHVPNVVEFGTRTSGTD